MGVIEIELGDGRQIRVGSDVNQAALRRVLAAALPRPQPARPGPKRGSSGAGAVVGVTGQSQPHLAVPVYPFVQAAR